MWPLRKKNAISTNDHRTHVYVGLAGEGENIGPGGLYRLAPDNEWENATVGMPPNSQVRALLVHPQSPQIVYAGTHLGPFRTLARAPARVYLRSVR